MKICMLFPGYGSQFVGMAKDLYDESRIMQEFFDTASHCADVNFVKLCFASSEVELAKTANAYMSLLLVSASISEILKAEGIVPDCVAGYNNGVCAALFAAGGGSFADGLYMINKFAAFYQELLKELKVSGLRVDGIEYKKLHALCKKASTKDEHVSIAISTTDTLHSITGHAPAVDRVRAEIVPMEGVTADVIGVEIGLHSELMEPVVKNMMLYSEKVDFIDLKLPLITQTEAKKITQGADVKQVIIDGIKKPVLWMNVLNALDEFDCILEIGPGTQLSSLVKEKYPDKLVLAINNRGDIETLKTKLGMSTPDAETKTDGDV